MLAGVSVEHYTRIEQGRGVRAVAFLRRDSARELDDPQLPELVGELSLKSEHFGRWWNSRDVKDKASGTKRFNHPTVGELELQYETLLPGAAEDQAVVIYTAEPGTPSHTALQLLSTLIAPKRPHDADVQLPGPVSRRARDL
jgi:hypothetical protein